MRRVDTLPGHRYARLGECPGTNSHIPWKPTMRPSSSRGDPIASRSLPEVRAMIDALDHEVLQLLARRNGLVARIAHCKREQATPIRDLTRERDGRPARRRPMQPVTPTDPSSPRPSIPPTGPRARVPSSSLIPRFLPTAHRTHRFRLRPADSR